MLVRDAVARKLGLGGDASMTSDGLFSLETVSCLGACGLAPVMTVNDRVFGELTDETVGSIIDDLKAEALASQADAAKNEGEVEGDDSRTA
jgi:NADH-quinone oxidoreductase subunit E